MPPKKKQGEGEPGGNGKPTGEQPTGGGTPLTWEQVLGSLSPEARALYEADVSGLKTALAAERDSVKTHTDELRQVRDQLKDSPGREVLDKVIGERDAAQQRAEFYEAATQPDIGCADPRLAYLAAVDEGLIDQRGRVNWEALKTAHPGLFKQTAPGTTHAGAGTHQPPGEGKFDMNQAIRAARGGRS